MKNWKQTAFIGILVFCALLFTACNRGKTAEESEGGPGDDYEALPVGFGYPYTAILDGNLDEWKGTWVNGRGESVQLRADGTFNTGQTAYDFTRGVDNNSRFIANGTNYEWIVNSGGEAGGFEVWLFPVGIEIRNYDGEVVQTNKTKDRIFIELVGSSDEAYYWKGELPAIEAGISENAAAVILKHLQAIENGDLAAFRSTLKEPEDGSDINFQLRLIHRFFGDLLGVDVDGFDEAFASGEGLDQIRHTAFAGVFPLRKKNTGMFIKQMNIVTNHDFREQGYNELIKVVTSNNRHEETVYYLAVVPTENGYAIDKHF